MLWFAFALSLPFRTITNWLALAALASGIVKRHGLPKFNKEFLQRIMLDDNFQMLFYLSSVALAMTPNFIVYSPLVLTAFIEGSDAVKQLLDKNPRIPIISMFRDSINKGVMFRG